MIQLEASGLIIDSAGDKERSIKCSSWEEREEKKGKKGGMLLITGFEGRAEHNRLRNLPRPGACITLIQSLSICSFIMPKKLQCSSLFQLGSNLTGRDRDLLQVICIRLLGEAGSTHGEIKWNSTCTAEATDNAKWEEWGELLKQSIPCGLRK